jgi:hemoglobin/transferrin/lactoferrin receptor protein
MGHTAYLRLWLLATAASFVLTVPAQGQEQAQQQAAQEAGDSGGLLDMITVVASKFDEEVINSLTSTSVVGGERLQQKQPSDIKQVLTGVPGVSTAGSQDRTGLGTSINIRGLQDFGRVAMITDGARNNFSRNDHGSAASMWIEPELLKQVTVVRGPVANIYGSGAIGGVVVFETKSASDFLREGEQFGGSLKGGYETNGDGFLTSVTGAIKPVEAFDLLGNFTYRERDDYKGGDGDTVDDSNYEVNSGLAKGVIRPADGHEITLGWIGNNNSWREPSESMAQETDLKENVFTGKYRFTPGNDLVDLTLSGYVNDTKMDQTSLGSAYRWQQDGGGWVLVPKGSERNFDLTTTGFDINNVSRFETGTVKHTFTVGGDWFDDDVNVKDPLGGSSVYSPSGNREVWGAFVQDKLEFSNWLEVIGGLRYDSYKLESDDGEVESDDDRISPRITVGVKPFESTGLNGLQVYGTYAEGYRSPSVIETLMSGQHPAGVVFPFLPNPELTPETAHLFEVGINYKRDGLFTPEDGLRVKAAVFHNTVNDYIGLATLSPFARPPVPGCNFPIPPPPPPPGGVGGGIPICNQYQNFDEVILKGFEFEATYDNGRFFAGLSGTYLETENKKDGNELLSAPQNNVSTFAGVRFLESRAVVGSELQYYFQSTREKLNEETTRDPFDEVEFTIPDYALVNVFAGYAVTDDFRLDLRLENIFDQRYTNYLNEAMKVGDFYEPGFNAKISATFRFGG